MSRMALVAAGCWLLASACATTPERHSVLTNEHVREYAALLRMTDSRTLDTLLVDRGLASASSAVRVLAARAVGQLGRVHGAPRVASLRSLLRATDTEVAAQAAHSLGLLRDTAGIPDLVGGLAGSPRVAREAAWALGQAGGAARGAITEALARHHVDAGTRAQLLLASAKLAPVPAASVIPYFYDEHPSVVWAAAYAISRTRTPAGLRALMALADTLEALAAAQIRRAPPALAGISEGAAYIDAERAPYRIRAEIARALPRSATGDSLAAGAIARLARLARDPHPHVRINALRALATYGAHTRAIVAGAVHDPDANVRVVAAQGIGMVRDSASVDWGALWAADTALAYRQALVEAAMRFGVELPALPEWNTASDWRRRATVASAAGGAPSAEQRIRLAGPLLADADARVRASAIAGIAPDTNSLSGVVRTLLAAAGADPDRQVRERAASRLTGRPENEAEPAAPVRDLAWYVAVVRAIVAPALAGTPARVVFVTERGPIGIEFFGAEAPLTVKNFLDLARGGTFRGTRFHRVVPNFVAQDGDPRGDGSGGPGYSIRDELNPHRYDRGALGMALSGPDTGGSQWFITHSPQPHLDGGYTVFGRVVSGLEALDRIVQGDRMGDVR